MTNHQLATENTRLNVISNKKHKPRNRPRLFAVTIDLLQIELSLSILLLPIFATCRPQGQGTICERESYIQIGGSALGYGFLVLIIAVSVMAIVSTRIGSRAQVCRLRWVGVLFSASFVFIGAWSIGLFFLPSTLCLLVAALACRQRTYATQ